MTLFKSIERSQILLQQLSNNDQTDGNLNLLSSLAAELETISILAQQLTEKEPEPIKPEIKSGCYVFIDEKGFFCPNCYDNASKKIPTKRMNSQLRVCPACHASIK